MEALLFQRCILNTSNLPDTFGAESRQHYYRKPFYLFNFIVPLRLASKQNGFYPAPFRKPCCLAATNESSFPRGLIPYGKVRDLLTNINE